MPTTTPPRFEWRHVLSAEPFAAVLLPGAPEPVIAVNDSYVDTSAELDAIARWADGCLARADMVAFLLLVDFLLL